MIGKRFQPFDSLRGLAIIGVILIHVTGSYISKSNVSIIINQLSRFAVPSFLIISGWGLTIKKEATMNYFSYIGGKFKKILPLYFVWSLIFFLINAYLGTFKLDLIQFLYKFIFGTIEYHLYYIPLALFFFIVYPIMYKILKSRYGLVSVLIVTLISQYLGLIQIVPKLFVSQNIFNWIFYFSFGIWLAFDFDSKRTYLIQHKKMLSIMLILSVLCVFVSHQVLFSIVSNTVKLSISTTSMRGSVIFYSVIIVSMFISLDIRNIFLENFGRHSYGIYLCHPLFLMIILKIEKVLNVNVSYLSLVVINFIFVIVSSYTLCKLCMYIFQFFSKGETFRKL